MKLLRQLASQVLPVYQVVAREAILQDVLGYQVNSESKWAERLPNGAYILAREKVRNADGWWVRIWTGQWLQVSCVILGEELGGMPVRAKSMVEQCDPSTEDVRHWLQEAARTRRSLLLDNAIMVARQYGLDPEDHIPQGLRSHLQTG